MKIRNGFVSNSSSSSFVIAVKDRKTLPSRAELMELFGVQEGSVAEKLLAPYFDLIKTMEKQTEEELVDNYGWDAPGCKTVADIIEKAYSGKDAKHLPRELKLFNEGWTVFDTLVSNEDYDNPIGAAIHMMDIDIKTDNVQIYHAGY